MKKTVKQLFDAWLAAELELESAQCRLDRLSEAAKRSADELSAAEARAIAALRKGETIQRPTIRRLPKKTSAL